MSGRLEVRISVDDVGKRVSVRTMTGAGPGQENFTDTVGVLTSWTSGVLWITRRDGRRVSLEERLLVAGKVVPSTPARRRGLPVADADELSRVAARAWPALEHAELGGWWLRAANGFTRRANSALPLGDPGVPTHEALEHVRRWYDARGLPPCVQTTTGADGTGERLAAVLDQEGWRVDSTAELWIARLAPVADLAAEQAARAAEGAESQDRVRLTRTFTDGWSQRYARAASAGSEVSAVLGNGPDGGSLWFASVPGEETTDEPPAAIGRLVVDGRWAGFTAMETAAAHRRTGLAGVVMAALCEQALKDGASAAYLQVETDNEGARRMYERLGFARHHSYQHWRPATG